MKFRRKVHILINYFNIFIVYMITSRVNQSYSIKKIINSLAALARRCSISVLVSNSI